MTTSEVKHPGRLSEATSTENINKIHYLVIVDRRLKVLEIASTLDFSNKGVHNILYQQLNMKKLSAR